MAKGAEHLRTPQSITVATKEEVAPGNAFFFFFFRCFAVWRWQSFLCTSFCLSHYVLIGYFPLAFTSRCLTRCLPLLLFSPLIILFVMMFSIPVFLMTCSKSRVCLSLILTHDFLPVSPFLSTSSLVILSM